MSSGGGPQQLIYEDLMSETRQLQQQLAQSFEVIKDLRQESDLYRRNFEELKIAHVRMQEICEQLKSQMIDMQNEKVALQKSNDEISRKWKAQLDVKIMEIEELKLKITPPSEFEKIRIQLIQELEIPHREHISLLEQDLEKFRSAFFTLRREHELLKTEYEQVNMEHGNIVRDWEESHKSTVALLTNRIQALQAGQNHEAEVERSRSLLRELEDYKTQNRFLKIENDEIREEKEKSELEKASQSRVYERQIHDLQHQLRTLTHEKEGHSQRIRFLEQEVSSALKNYEQAMLLSTNLEEQKKQLRVESQQQSLELNRMIADLRDQIHTLERDLESRLQEHSNELKQKQEELSQSLHKAQEMQRRYDDLDRSITSKVMAARREDMERSQKLESENISLEERNRSLSQQIAEMDARITAQSESNDREVQALSSELKVITAERNNLQSKEKRMAGEIEDLKKDVASKTKNIEELQQERTDLQNANRRLVEAEQDLKAEKERLDLALDFSKSELQNAQAEILKEREIKESEIRRTKKAALMREEKLKEEIRRLRTAKEALLARQAKFLATLKKMKETFYLKVKDFKEKETVLIEHSARMEKEKMQQYESTEAEKRELRSQLLEIQRSLDHVRLSMRENIAPLQSAADSPSSTAQAAFSSTGQQRALGPTPGNASLDLIRSQVAEVEQRLLVFRSRSSKELK